MAFSQTSQPASRPASPQIWSQLARQVSHASHGHPARPASRPAEDEDGDDEDEEDDDGDYEEDEYDLDDSDEDEDQVE